MAIDTAKKRRMAMMTAVRLLPAPDGTIDPEDRAGLCQVYYQAVLTRIFDWFTAGFRIRL